MAQVPLTAVGEKTSQLHKNYTKPKEKGLAALANPMIILARLTGLEPATYGLEVLFPTLKDCKFPFFK